MGIYYRQKRRAIIITPIILIISGLIFLILYPYFNPKPTCFDHKLNAMEFGVDCGGACQRICLDEIIPLKVISARAIETEPDLYDLVAMVQNDNKGREIAGAKFNFKFEIYDESGTLIQTINSSSSLPIGTTFPVIIQNIPLALSQSGNSVSRVIGSASYATTTWLSVGEEFNHNFFTVNSQSFERVKNNISQLSVTIQNLTQAEFRQIPVRVTLANKEGNFIGVNSTILPNIKPRSEATVYFTWRNPLPIDDPEVIVYPIVTPESDFR